MFFVGVDGGGTNTRVCILNEKKELIGIAKSGPSSIDTVSITDTIKSIKDALNEVFIENNVKDPYIKSIFIGLGGVLTESSKDFVRNHVKQIEFFDHNSIISVENDVYSALLGGLANKSGIALISGTGSVAFGLDEEGHTYRAGGYGYQEGDLGSAYHLGKKAIMITARAFDKRIPETDFTKELINELKINNVNDLLDRIMYLNNHRTKVAQLAQLVTKYANLGDIIALNICDEGINELALCVRAVYMNLNLQNKEVAIIGSLGNSKGYFNDNLKRAILAIDPKFIIHEPLIEPVIGSAYQAYKLAKIE